MNILTTKRLLLKLTMLSVLCILIGIVLATISIGISGGYHQFYQENFGLNKEQEEVLAIHDIEALNLNISAAGIEIIPTDEQQVRFVVKYRDDKQYQELLDVQIVGNTLTFTRKTSWRILSFGQDRMNLKIYVPKTSIYDLNANLSASKLTINESHLKSLTFNLSAAKLNLKNNLVDEDITIKRYKTSDVYLTSTDLKSIDVSKMSTSKLILDHVKIEKSIDARLETSTISIKNSQLNELKLKLETSNLVIQQTDVDRLLDIKMETSKANISDCYPEIAAFDLDMSNLTFINSDHTRLITQLIVKSDLSNEKIDVATVTHQK